MSWKLLAALIGPTLAARVSAALHGRRVRIGKKPEALADLYAEGAGEYDRMPARQVACVLGCGERRIYSIRLERKIIMEKQAENRRPSPRDIP